MVRQPKTAAWRPDLSEHGGQGDNHPVFLLAILLALHAPSGHQHGGILVKYRRKFAYLRRRNATNLCRPFCRFCNIIRFTQQIVGKTVISGGTPGEKVLVMPAVFHQRMRDAQHQRHVGPHMRGNPFHLIAKEIDAFRSHRIDTDQPFTAVAQCLKVREALLIGRVPGNLQGIQRIGAPQHHHLAVLQHHRPAGLLLVNFVPAHHVRHDRLRSPRRVIPQMPGITARQRHITL